MLDRVRDVDVVAGDPGLLEAAVEHAAGRTDERMPLDVLAITGLLADQHQARVRRAFAHHGLGRALPQVARAASLNRLALLLHQPEHAAANVRSFQLRYVTDALSGIKQEREGKSLARAERPAGFVCGDFRVGPRVMRAKAITINAGYGIVVAKADLDGECHKPLEDRNGQVGHAGPGSTYALDNYSSFIGLKVSHQSVPVLVHKTAQHKPVDALGVGLKVGKFGATIVICHQTADSAGSMPRRASRYAP